MIVDVTSTDVVVLIQCYSNVLLKSFKDIHLLFYLL